MAVCGSVAGPAPAAERFITVASTTSTRDSGLFEHLLPHFTGETGIEVRIVAVGTGRALRLGERGDVDAVLVHDRSSEEEFVAKGFGIERSEVMVNSFVLVGPGADPAGVRNLRDARAALAGIAEAESFFTSRADDSGTHKAELRLWQSAGIDPRPHSGRWYRETGTGMGATLNTAAELGAYALSDSGTWRSFKNRRDLTASHRRESGAPSPREAPLGPALRRLADLSAGPGGHRELPRRRRPPLPRREGNDRRLSHSGEAPPATPVTPE
jgi:tungstate transport system substrate-binding protein